MEILCSGKNHILPVSEFIRIEELPKNEIETARYVGHN